MCCGGLANRRYYLVCETKILDVGNEPDLLKMPAHRRVSFPIQPHKQVVCRNYFRTHHSAANVVGCLSILQSIRGLSSPEHNVLQIQLHGNIK